MQCVEGETSCATAQVAGVAALLLQKNSSLTPTLVKKYLVAGASDVTAGSTFSGQLAGPGKDPATGSGFDRFDWLRDAYRHSVAMRFEDDLPRAGAVARIAARRFARGAGIAAARAAPLYLRDKVALTTEERHAKR